MWIAALRHFTWTGLRRGMGGSRVWMIVAIVAVGARSIRRISRREPEVLYRTKLATGDGFILTSRPPG
jgi:hypothetical protein